MTGGRSPRCADCGEADARTHLGDRQLCDRCVNASLSACTGWPALPDPPPVETVRAADGRAVRFRYRLTWALSGVIGAEAEEADQPPGDGFRFVVYGEHDADPEAVLTRLRQVVEQEVGRAYLEPNEVGGQVSGSAWTITGDEVAGRVDWSGDDSVREPSVVIDGRRVDWDEFGRMVAGFEGWTFRMQFDDSSEILGSGVGGEDGSVEGDDAEVVPLFGALGSGDHG